MLNCACILLQTYHTAADRLQLIPVTAKYAAGVQFEIQLDRAGATAADIITADLKVGLLLALITCCSYHFTACTTLLLASLLLSRLADTHSLNHTHTLL